MLIGNKLLFLTREKSDTCAPETVGRKIAIIPSLFREERQRSGNERRGGISIFSPRKNVSGERSFGNTRKDNALRETLISLAVRFAFTSHFPLTIIVGVFRSRKKVGPGVTVVDWPERKICGTTRLFTSGEIAGERKIVNYAHEWEIPFLTFLQEFPTFFQMANKV